MSSLAGRWRAIPTILTIPTRATPASAAAMLLRHGETPTCSLPCGGAARRVVAPLLGFTCYSSLQGDLRQEARVLDRGHRIFLRAVKRARLG